MDIPSPDRTEACSGDGTAVSVVGSTTNCTDSPAPPPEARLRFTGSGSEYFRIWSVNMTLSILTLGLYSAWAKVRRLQYFYRHTELDGAVFDYVASPSGILFGRVLGLVLLVVYYLAFEYSPWTGAAITVLLAALLPWLLWQSNRFKARNTRYRGLSFSFTGTVRDAYRVYLPPVIISFGPPLAATLWLNPRAEDLGIWLSVIAILVLPVLHAMYRRYVQAFLRFGTTPFEFSATGKEFAAIWLRGLGVIALGAIAFGLLVSLISAVGVTLAGKSQLLRGVLLFGALLAFWLAYQLTGSYFTARFQKLVWEKTRVAGLGFRCDISAWRLLRLQAVNTLWVILSLGAYRPFAAVRVAQYRLQSMTAVGTNALDHFVAAPGQGRTGATGESAAELFDMDVGI